MASFRMLPFIFLLLNVLSDIQAEGNCLSCSNPNIAELGKNFMITCKNNEPIHSMGLKYCPLNGNNCTSIRVIEKEKVNLINGEATLEIQNNMAVLHINQIKISHEGTYTLNYVNKNCMDNQNLSLEVFAPYTNPQVMKQKDTLICTASGGYPEEKLYWVSKAGTNLAHKSTFQSVKNEDGSFNLSNTLQLESAASETECYCTFKETRIPRTQPTSAYRGLEHVTPFTFTGQETTRKIGIVIAVISLASILLAAMCWRKRRKNYHLWEKKSIVVCCGLPSSLRSQSFWEACDASWQY